jgi:glucose/arabinose dehydrogenase
MKKSLFALLGIACVAFVAWAGFFYYQNLRGVGPALNKPSGDIAQQIDAANALKNTTVPAATAVNPAFAPVAAKTTSMPLTLPAGFSISIFAENLGDPRAIIEGPDGLFLVSIPGQGKVIALEDKGGKAGQTFTVVEGLDYPHGLATRCDAKGCKLFVGETTRLDVFDYDKITHKASNRTKLADLPGGGNHITRSLLFLPPPNDNQLLISIGSSCNVCHESDPMRATIYAINVDGTGLREYAKGLRNSVFMAVNPSTNEVWATDNGRDLLGDDIPPDEVNIIQDGKNYGWPVCYGQNVHDTQFDKNTYIRNPCMAPFETPSHIDLQAHSAPLGLAFFPKEGWPAEFQNNLLVAYHGSWNRSVPTGYKVVRFKLDDKGNVLSSEDFITGWLQNDGTTLGRPVDPLIRNDGTILLTDDKAGVIYRIAYKP